MKPLQERFQKNSSLRIKNIFAFYNLLSGSASKQGNKMSSTKKLVAESNKTVVLTIISGCDSCCL